MPAPRSPSRMDLPRVGLVLSVSTSVGPRPAPSTWVVGAGVEAHAHSGAGVEPEASGGRVGGNSGWRPQALLSDSQMCSSCGDQPGPAMGLLTLFQELLGGESSGPSAAEEQ